MMSFVITTEDGKIIVIDGGYHDDADKLLRELQTLSGKEKPHVDAWFLTHAHEDHINALRNNLRDEAIEEIDRQGKNYQTSVYYMDLVGELEKMGDFMINVSQDLEKAYK